MSESIPRAVRATGWVMCIACATTVAYHAYPSVRNSPFFNPHTEGLWLLMALIASELLSYVWSVVAGAFWLAALARRRRPGWRSAIVLGVMIVSLSVVEATKPRPWR